MIVISVDDQINEKNVALIIKGGELTCKTLVKAMEAALKETKQKENKPKRGKQSIKELCGQGTGISNIEINDKNIKAFESVARKYGVDFAVKKDVSKQPPKWLVFFKGRDVDVITAAFKEFSAKQLNKKSQKPSILKNIRNLMAKVKSQVINKTKNKNRGRNL